MSSSAYISDIDEVLRPKVGKFMALDLFAGCGGLSLGFEAAGFSSMGIEIDGDCCSTYNRNLNGKCIKMQLTIESDLPKADVVIGGPPCQPFSVGGEQKGLKDSRNGFPIFINAIRNIKPKVWLFENVRGFIYKNRWYFEEIVKELKGLGYIVEPELLNAVNYGVPQNRERIIVVGHRGDFKFPIKQSKKVTVGEALGELSYQITPDSKFITPQMDKCIARYEEASKCVVPRDLYLDKPARTLTCRNLAGNTGDMQRIRLSDGRRRRLSVREAARLQSFPDWFEFSGSKTSVFNQIGNAVPPLLAYYLAEKIKECLGSEHIYSLNEINARQNAIRTGLLFESKDA